MEEHLFWKITKSTGHFLQVSMYYVLLSLNSILNKQPRRPWFETPSRSLWRHCNDLKIWNHVLSRVLNQNGGCQFNLSFEWDHAMYRLGGKTSADVPIVRPWCWHWVNIPGFIDCIWIFTQADNVLPCHNEVLESALCINKYVIWADGHINASVNELSLVQIVAYRIFDIWTNMAQLLSNPREQIPVKS